MSTCSISFSEKEGHMSIIHLQNKHVIKERGNRCEKVRKTGGGGKREGKVATWHGR